MEKPLRPSLVFNSKAKYQMIHRASLKKTLLGTNTIACFCCSICDKEKKSCKIDRINVTFFFFETETNKLECIFHGNAFEAYSSIYQ